MKVRKLLLAIALVVVGAVALSPYVRISTSEIFGVSIRTSQDAKFQTLYTLQVNGMR